MEKNIFEKNISLFSIIFRIVEIESVCIYVIDEKCKYNQIYFKSKNKGNFFIDDYTILRDTFYSNDISDRVKQNIYCTFDIKNMMNITVRSKDVNNIHIGNIIIINKKENFNNDDYLLFTEYIDLITNLIAFTKNESFVYTQKKDDVILSNMSHEIRTPLNGIIGYTQLLGKTRMNDIQKNYLNAVNTCCYQLLQIVNDVLDYAKLDAGKMKKVDETFHINELTNSIQDILGNSIKSKYQKFTVKIAKDCPEIICSDKSKLVQVLVNLVNNANKFSPEYSKIVLKIKNYRDNFLLFSVSDKGAGISETDKLNIFNAFSQLKNTSKIKSGTGLGLAISKKLVYLLEGDIWYDSKVDIGTTFYFTVKYQIPVDYESTIKDSISMLNGIYILLVDDNPDNRVVISEYLYEWGMIPITCASALEALRMIINDRHPFFLGLIDIYMPGTNGIELASQIKHEKNDFPMIAISSATEILDYKNFEYRIEKPVNRLRLFNIICKVVKKYRSDSSHNTRLSPLKIPSDPITNIDVRILVAEDVKHSAMLLEAILANIGIKNIDIAYDGLEAISLLEKNSYNIVFLDIKMPKADGYQVIDYIKNNDIKTKIVVVTASVLEDEKRKCTNNDIRYFISKPIIVQEIENLVKKILV